MNSSKEKYKKLCAENTSIPVFLRYNWYNTLFHENEWGVVIEENNDEVVGFIPYYIVNKLKFNLVASPTLTPYQGVWLNYPPNQKYTNRLSFEKEVMTSLISKLPKSDGFKQKFYPSFTNWLPFYWKGFTQTTKYTYVLEDLTDLEKVFDDFRENIRREIRKAEKSLTIEHLNNAKELYLLKLAAYNDKNEKYPLSEDFLNKAVDFCTQNNCGEVLVAKDQEGIIHSVLFYVWDNDAAYYLHGATNISFKTSGSMSLLLWEAIKRSQAKTNTFNFEGSMIEPIERYFRAFGGKQTPYFEISKTNSKVLKLLNY
jgi:lipid II:glycine glycyltransferase (peptidoglycan interpeptide bridge formation enzyme)